MSTSEKRVYVVDDDLAVRKALTRTLTRRAYGVEVFVSAEDFLTNYKPNHPSCLVLDVRMPGMSGLELQKELISRQIKVPIIFITGHGDIPMSVRAIKDGAVEFLEKPYEVEQLLERIDEALSLDAEMLSNDAKNDLVNARFKGLTSREREVMTLLVAGASNASNKTIARKLSISHRTVDDHRASVMAKMQARSLPELVIMAMICGIYQP